MGIRTKYTPERVKRIVDAIRLGATQEMACNYAGIGVSTLHDWFKAHPTFEAQVREAEGAAGVGWLAKIEKAANEGAWQAAAWKLERRYPQQYGRQVTEIQGANGGPVQVEVSAARAKLANLIERRQQRVDPPAGPDGC